MTKPRPIGRQGQTDARITWFPAKRTARPEGLALVIHGLNLRPRKMSPIIDALTGAGIEALNLSLRGHGENDAHHHDMRRACARAESLLEATYELWSGETHAAYRVMAIKGARLGVPTFLVGFSLGALLGVDLWTSNADVRFDRSLLFAPAFDLRTPCRLLRLMYPLPRLILPSFGRREYLANRGVPIVAYRTLLETIRHFRDHIGPQIDLPTLIFIDRGDEFVPYKKVQGIITENRLHQWEISFVKKGTDSAVNLKHMIIDEAALGRRMWHTMMAKGIRHLLESRKDNRDS